MNQAAAGVQGNEVDQGHPARGDLSQDDALGVAGLAEVQLERAAGVARGKAGPVDALGFVDVPKCAVVDARQVVGGDGVVGGDRDRPLGVGGGGPLDEEVCGEDQEVGRTTVGSQAAVDIGLDGANALGVGGGRRSGVGEVVGEPVGMQVGQRADT
ncbi:hypothetical protein [Actinophytocola gossypii]|uniref:hypothetical protein n=1 Tax=Actinophytocola gossypii TaxID=2812003 RepID=UPI0021A8865C|nr:hypothetical protein [Actinophytocola gossypii]